MEKYTKSKCIEEPLERSRIPINCLPETFLWMKVRPNSKLRNLLGIAMESLKTESTILWTGSGSAVIKAISCAEIMKRKFKNLHQITKLCFRKITETWEPISEPGLDELVVERNVPTIHILLSKDILDSATQGYQSPGKSKVYHRSEDISNRKKNDFYGRTRFNQHKQKKFIVSGKKEEPISKLNVPKSVMEDENNLKRKRASESEPFLDSPIQLFT